MSADTLAPVRGGIAARVRGLAGGSLARNSLNLMLGTVATSLLGYVYWALAARLSSPGTVGLAAGLVAACSASSLFTHLGPGMFFIEELERTGGTRTWRRILGASLVWTPVLTLAVAGFVLMWLRWSDPSLRHDMHASTIALALVGSCAWTITGLLGYLFIASRRASLTMVMNSSISVVKLVLLVGLAPLSRSVDMLMVTWTVSAVLGAAGGLLVLMPRLGHGRPSPALPRANRRQLSAIGGHHITSSAGALLPYIIPTMVVARLGASQNAFFYSTWMIAGGVFLIGPSVASALFAEGVRSNVDLAAQVRSALRLTGGLLVVGIFGCAALGKYVLAIFGAGYAHAGYPVLLVLLASAVPDALSSIASGAYRARGQLSRAVRLNVVISIVAIASSWLLIGPFGIVGAAAGWGIGQTVGFMMGLPLLLSSGRTRTA